MRKGKKFLLSTLITQHSALSTLFYHTPPYSQTFRYTVAVEQAGKEIVAFHCERFVFKSREEWTTILQSGDMTVNNHAVTPGYVLQVNDVIRTVRHDVQEPDVRIDWQILHDANGVLILNKPAPLPVHPAGRYFKNSLIQILSEQNPHIKYHTIHRLDSLTTGVLVMATEREVAKFLHDQVEQQSIKKVYGVLAVGLFAEKHFVVNTAVGRLIRSGQGSVRGTGPDIKEPKESITQFEVIAQNNGITLLKAIPITGRTNQIRVHIESFGGHVLNDPLYAPHPVENPHHIGLHCRAMSLALQPGQPQTTFVADWPEHFAQHFALETLNQIDKSSAL